jgi:large repetitive protein
MSNKVVTAPAGHAKRPVRSQKQAQQAQKQLAATEEEARLAQNDSEMEVEAKAAQQQGAEAVETETSMAGGFTFGAALADAAASAGSLISEASDADSVGFGQMGDDDGDGSTILLIGAIALVALGVVVLVSDGGKKNGPPTITAPAAGTTAEDTALTINAPTTSDPDGDAVTVTATATNGAIVRNANGSFTYTPTANFNGTGVITYTASDGVLTATVTQNVTVTPVNDAPTLTLGAAPTIAEDTAAGSTFTATTADVDTGQVVTTAATVPAAQGTVTKNADGSFTYVPAANFNGTATVTVTATDGTATVTQTANITVTPVDDPAVIVVGTVAAIQEDSAAGVTFTATASDPDGGPAITTSATVPAAQGMVTKNADGTFTFKPAANFNGTATVTITADGVTPALTQAVSITVTSVNDPAVLAPLTATTAEDTALNLSDIITITDVDGDPAAATVAVTTNPQNGVITIVNGDVIYTPSQDYNGPDAIGFTVTDSGGLAATYTVAINVTPVDDGPVITTASIDVGTSNVAAQRDASTANFNYTDNAEATTNVNITNFGANDKITVTNATSGEYNFVRSFEDIKDLVITYTDADTGATNTITIQDILPLTGPVNSFASAVSAVGFNFITFA